VKVKPVVNRLDEVKLKVNEELMKIEARRKELQGFLSTLTYITHGGGETTTAEPSSNGTRVLSMKARRAIAKAQRARWRKVRREQKQERSPSAYKGKINASQPGWSPKHDAVIITTMRRVGPISGPDFSRSLAKRLKRTPGAVWQHVKRMSERDNPAVKVTKKDGQAVFEAVS
jgi:hypothetical protein